ncbi:phospholipid-transporting ATPase ID [Takifugu flavidus]|uniref:phospholipid-transporting ATPase ID n=1 Tax=Takifugu flavidus TaxID=433684 RepID=UPI00254413CF|nr:phospholipid-transporting ATPase ID [Takifugu flavidus]XP_056875094.1 phospholipid-transporting ATPase ID [Takifugu flavidus]XP_056875095.1 phospholipid-transporting ATPase ID [Takifugu flavidus]
MGSLLSYCGGLCGKQKHAETERRLRANDRPYNLTFGYANNAIKTSKYNLLSFLPLNLFEQFRRLANAYFLFLLILQVIPQVSSLPWYTTAVPLVFVLSITAVKDATDDIRRHNSDNQVNNRMVDVLIDGELRSEKWMNVQVGDIIKLQNNQFVTADLLLLSSSEPLNLVYVETAELDGETNLKVKQASTVTGEMGDAIDVLAKFNGEVQCEPPNNYLDKFRGNLIVNGQTYGLDNDKILLRGCTLRNTEWCFGLVVFGGPDTKLMQNSGKTVFKRTSVDHLMNIIVLCIFGLLASLCAIMTIGNYIWEEREGNVFTPFLPREPGTNLSLSVFLSFWSYVIVLNTLVPISLYVSVEFIRLGNSFFINWDRKMYYPKNNTPAQARTTTLNEELGQIKYVFSDKTGTLTQNIMTFNRCSISGRAYGELLNFAGQRVEITEKTEKVDFSWNKLADPKFAFYDHSLLEAVKDGNAEVQDFFRLLALCHTVMPEEKKEGELNYQAQSPDEGALVTAARNFGFVFRSRTPETIMVVEMGRKVVYELLAILDFNNVRKRMSVIVRSPEGRLTLYCKGADTIVFERLHPSCNKLKEVTTSHLNEYAGDGLRTLALAYKDLDEDYIEGWKRRHYEATIAMDGREEKLDELYEEIEKDLQLLGVTAVEDKLQDGVPQTIEQLAKADMKIWVLTGDKQETAENIGYSCNMLREEMNDIFIVSANTAEGVKEELQNARRKMCPDSADEPSLVSSRSGLFWLQRTQTLQDEKVDGEYGLIINGHSLAFALDNFPLELLRMASMCQTVICCRVTPLQKAKVVELVKKYKQAVTLAIGDGANDVSMIKAAHIGIGISGQEGMQAVLSSDFSFAQFRYLQRLLLVHGRWSYLRMCKFLRYFFFKNFTYTLTHFWYAFFCGFSAQNVYDEWFITVYNLVYTALPVFSLSIFDQDVNDRWSFQHPQLYTAGQLNMYFSKKAFLRCLMHGSYSSFILFFVPWASMQDTVRDDGKDIADYQSFAILVQTCLMVVVTVQLFLDTHYWTAVNHFFTWGSLAAYFALTFTMCSNGMFLIFTSYFPFLGTGRNSLNQPNVWLTVFLTTLLCALPVVAFRFVSLLLRPTINDKVRYKMHNEPPPAPAPRRPPTRRISTRRSSYAFSHSQGYGDLVTSKKFLLRPLRPRPALFLHPDSAVAQSQPQHYRTITEEPEGSQVS